MQSRTSTLALACVLLLQVCLIVHASSSGSLSFVSEVVFAPARAVAMVDRAGNICTQESPTVAVALTTGTGVLSGTKVVVANEGVATFTDLSANLVGTNKVLTFTHVNMTLTTEPFNIKHGPPFALTFV
jgi:hypothetical protein